MSEEVEIQITRVTHYRRVSQSIQNFTHAISTFCKHPKWTKRGEMQEKSLDQTCFHQ